MLQNQHFPLKQNWLRPMNGNLKPIPTELLVFCIVEGVNFHVREDVINSDLNNLDIGRLKPVSRLGGITYGRTVDGYERLRPDFGKESATNEVKQLLE